MKFKAATGGNKKMLFPASPRGAALLCPILTTPPLQWSSEYTDLGLVYYNYRHYNPLDGRWTGRDMYFVNNLYLIVNNSPEFNYDYLGAVFPLIPIAILAALGLIPGCSSKDTRFPNAKNVKGKRCVGFVTLSTSSELAKKFDLNSYIKEKVSDIPFDILEGILNNITDDIMSTINNGLTSRMAVYFYIVYFCTCENDSSLNEFGIKNGRDDLDVCNFSTLMTNDFARVMETECKDTFKRIENDFDKKCECKKLPN